MKNICLQCYTLDELIAAIKAAMTHPSAKPEETTNASDSKPLSRKEAAKLLGITLATLNAWTKQDRITAYRMGTRVYYKKEELISSLEKINHTKYKKP